MLNHILNQSQSDMRVSRLLPRRPGRVMAGGPARELTSSRGFFNGLLEHVSQVAEQECEASGDQMLRSVVFLLAELVLDGLANVHVLIRE